MPLLPPVADARKVGLLVGEAVARKAIAEGVAGIEDADTLDEQFRDYVWDPVYLPYERIE
jgi:malate dehydrogenase (oxaloacetate-decarboxylating)